MRPLPLLALLVASLPAILGAAPNIVLIVSDDQGFRDVSFRGGDIPTPNIDRIAREGVRLDRFYTCPICSPTRAGMMTGRYPIRFGMQRAVCRPFLDIGVPPREETIAEMLVRAGYRVRAAVGKWHIGHSRKRYHPLRQGFTSFYGHYNGNLDYFTHIREGEPDWHRGFYPSADEGYTTELIADEAVRVVKESAGERPFFLYVAFNAPHTPLQAPESWIARFAGVEDPDRRVYSAMVAAMDAGIGRILNALDEAGIADDTLVWFTSDNGGARVADNGALRAGKGTVYEGGVRVAAAVRWPNGIPGGGRAVRDPLAYIDLWPTFARAAGVQLDEEHERRLDGLDALDALRGQGRHPDRPFFSYYERQAEESLALTEGEWKLVRRGRPILGPDGPEKPTIELFRILEDPGETRDLSTEHPHVVDRMLRRLRGFRAQRPEGGVPPMVEPTPEGWKAPEKWQVTEE